MKSIAALCLLGLAAAISLQNQETYGTQYTAEQVKNYLDTNKDGTVTQEEKVAGLKKALSEGKISKAKANEIASQHGITLA